MENKKIKTRFNAFDLLIVIIIIGMVALVVWRSEIKQIIDNTEHEEIVYSFVVKNVDEWTAKKLVPGVKLTESDTGASLGEIIETDVSDSHMKVMLVDGSYEDIELSGELSGKKDVVCIVRMTAVKKEYGYFTENGTMIVSGKRIKAESAAANFGEIEIKEVSERAGEVNSQDG